MLLISKAPLASVNEGSHCFTCHTHIYPGLGQAPNMLACIPGGLVCISSGLVLTEWAVS